MLEVITARAKHILVALLGRLPHSVACWGVKPLRDSIRMLHTKRTVGLLELWRNRVRDGILPVWVIFWSSVALTLRAGADFYNLLQRFLFCQYIKDAKGTIIAMSTLRMVVVFAVSFTRAT